MRRQFGFLLIGATLIGAVSLWPIASGLADENINNTQQAQEQQVDDKKTNVSKTLPYITRAEAAELLVNSLELNLDGFRFYKAPEVSDFFDDVVAADPSANEIMILGYNGVLHTDDRSFCPSELITREEIAQICGGLLQRKAQGQVQMEVGPQINDLNKANKVAVDDIKLLVGLKIMVLTEDGNFQPDRGVLAEELKNVIKRLEPFLKVKTNDITAEVVTGKEGCREVEISWGEKPSSGYELTISKIDLQGNTLMVYYQTKEPTPSSYNSTVITEPKDSKPIPSNYPTKLDIKLVKDLKN
ncbi:hypothetical protein Dred_2172 [Desulforamulus reducens MI-1]|uniref:SLH domain-containing protein n=1 Tax=Desulforamulus reducens (strain ATCC BAA-1160 / DSM 100696 / MI-1) TaxID=349161 RepID=A4J6I6_DESRM|nr:protease complex subunit PrcB family protein [Desulforamulus reducens]ABO50689.1 hypothetical protein Dred_2172 [Desulforamulus reducens MI-1]